MKNEKIQQYSSDNYQVTKSNSLVERAQMRFSAMQQRVLCSALSQVRKDDKLTDDVTYKIPISAIADLAGKTSSGRFYAETKRAAKLLRSSDMVIKDKPDGSEMEQTIIASPFQTVLFNDDLQEIEIRFNRDVIPYFSGFKNKFIRYNINNTLLHMNNAYAYRLHDLVAKWGDIGTKEISIDEFRWMIGVEDKYPRFNNFRARVIEPAIRELNEHSQYQVKVGYRRARRRVVALQFAFRLKTQKNSKPGIRYITKSEVEKENLAHPGESWQELALRLKTQGIIIK